MDSFNHSTIARAATTSRSCLSCLAVQPQHNHTRTPLPLHETAATLHIAGRALPLNLGHLNPNGDVATEDLSGIQARLNNLGYTAGPNDGRYGRNTRAALALFQLDEDLDPSGLPDEETLARLEQRHGC